MQRKNTQLPPAGNLRVLLFYNFFISISNNIRLDKNCYLAFDGESNKKKLSYVIICGSFIFQMLSVKDVASLKSAVTFIMFWILLARYLDDILLQDRKCLQARFLLRSF